MTTYSSSVSPAPVLTDDSTLEAALNCLLAYLPLETQGECQPQTLYEVLLWAASHYDSIEHAAQCLTSVPTTEARLGQGNTANRTYQTQRSIPQQPKSHSVIKHFPLPQAPLIL